MPTYYSTAKDYNVCCANLAKKCKKMHPEFIKGKIVDLDCESDSMRRVFFKCDGIEYTIRMWNITEPTKGRVKIDYSVYEWYSCNDCNEEFARDLPDGWTRCDKCAKHYTDVDIEHLQSAITPPEN